MPSAKPKESPAKVTSSKRYLHDINVDDPNYQQELLRPANIKEDVKLMDARKRVSLILKSQTLRRELEEIIKQQLCSGPFHDTWDALHYLGDMYVPQAQYGPATASIFTKGSLMPALPINDFGATANTVAIGERILRCKVASLFRLVDIFGWASGFSGNNTMRLNNQDEGVGSNVFLINPLGLLFHEITASSLSKIDMEGKVVEGGSSMGLQVNGGFWAIHRAIHEARSDIRCVLHLNTATTIAISNMECGLLPLSQEAMIVGKSGLYDPHTFKRQESDEAESKAIRAALGPNSHLLFVKNFGLFIVGNSVEEVWHYAFNAMTACQTQVNLCPVGVDKIHIPSQKVQDMVFQQGSGDGSLGVNMSREKFDVGELEFQALMRQLDQVGYRTGYFYRPTEETFLENDRSLVTSPPQGQMEKNIANLRENLLLSPVPRVADDGDVYDQEAPIDIPPLKSSVAEKPFVGDEGGRQSSMAPPTLFSPVFDGGPRSVSSAGAMWLDTPNVYVRELLNEVGSPLPKTYTKWTEKGVEERAKSAVPPQKVETPNQFAPQGANPKEFQNRQRALKGKYFAEEKQAGPTSRLLTAEITDEEAAKLQDAREGRLGGDHVVVVGAVSQAIIKKDFQHNASVYQSVYATNPFNNMMTVDKQDTNTYQMTFKQAPNLGNIQEEPKTTTTTIEVTKEKETPVTVVETVPGPPPPPQPLLLSPGGTTSGAEISCTDDTEAPGVEEESGDQKSKKKKKKGVFKMPSFSKKSKHQHPK